MKKITFIQPYYHNIWESLGIGYIASYCRYHLEGNVKFNFLHGNFDENIVEKAKDSDIVAFSCTTPTYPSAVNIAKELKNNITVIGGWHPTSVPEKIDSVFDYVIVGEGETALLDVINENITDRIILGKKLQFSDLKWPDRSLIRNDRTLDLCYDMCGERIASFQSRRGCSHNCIFCSENFMTGVYDKENNPIRLRGSDDLLREIGYVSEKYNITRFKMVDPTWAFPKSSIVDFCNKKIERKNTIPFEAMCHISYMDKQLLELLKEANCDQLNYGVESGSQKLLNYMRKGITVKRIEKVFKWTKDVGIQTRGFFILGMPDESWDTLGETKNLIQRIKPDVFSMSLNCPYPGGELWNDKFEETDFSTMDEYSNDIWYTKNFTNKELKEIQKYFNGIFYDSLVGHQR